VEADWAVEIGSSVARIDADWAGRVDLRERPEALAAIAEAAGYPALQDALLLLNSAASPVFTSKCDVWLLTPEEIDPLEFEADAETSVIGIACYVDVIAREAERFASFDRHVAWVREAASQLRAMHVGNGRCDLVVRAATWQGREGFGLTVYAAGCGADTQDAETAWGAILQAAVTVTMRLATGPTGE
jgi:hypothetical protein